MAYPTTKTTIPNTNANDYTDAVDHNGIHNNIADTVNALQDKVGITSDTSTSSFDYKLNEVTGTDKAVGKTATQTLTNKTLTSPTISNPSITGAVINAPLTTPRITTSINDADGNEVIKTPATASAVNEITVTNSATGNDVQVTATGDDTNISLKLKAKGSGKVKIGSAELQIPNTDGTSGQFMTTDGAGNLSFASAISQTSIDLQKIDSDVDQSQTTQNSSSAVGEANATTKRNLLAQSFIPTKTGIAGVRLWKATDTGTFTGTVKIALQADSSGNPSGSDLASFTITNTAWLKLNSGAEFGVRFGTEYGSLSTASTYWIVVTCSTSDNSNKPNLGINTAGGYGNGVAKYWNTTDGWTTLTGQDLYFKTVEGLNQKLITSQQSDGLAPRLTRGYEFVNIGNTTVNANYSSGSSGTTVLYSTQLEGGLITANSGLKIDMIGRLLISSMGGFSSSVQFGVRYNGTTLITDTISSEVTTSGGYHVTRYTIVIRNQSSITNQSTRLFGDAQPDTALVTTLNRFRQATSTSTADFSQPGLLEIVGTAVGGGTSNVSATFYGCTVEKIS